MTKKRIFLAIAILSLASIVFIVYMSNKNKQTKTTGVTNTIGASYKELIPGKSTTDDIVNKLGTPVNEKQTDSIKTLEYKSQSNPNFNNEFLIRSDKLILVKEYVTLDDNINVTDINKKYGNYKNNLYGPASINGFNLYIIPEKGVAYVAHLEADIIIEMWYFQPTTFEAFRSQFASGYTDKPEIRQ